MISVVFTAQLLEDPPTFSCWGTSLFAVKMPKMKVPSEGSSSSNSKKAGKNGLKRPEKRFLEVFGDSGDEVR